MGCGASNRYRLPDYVIDTREVSGWLECMVSHTQRYLPSVEARLADGRLDESSRLVSERLERPIEGPMTVYRCAGKVTEMEILVHGLPYWATLRASYDPVGAPEFVLTCKNSDESTIELAASWEKTTGRPPPLCMEWEPQRKGAVSCAAILVAHRRTAGQCFGSFFAQDIHTSPEPGNHRLQIHRIFFLKPKLQITKTDHATGVSVGARSPSFLLFVAVSRQNGQERLCRPMSPEFLFGGDQPDEEKVRPLRYCRAGCFMIFWLNRT